MPSACLFCRIVADEIPVKRLYEDERLIAFADLHPQAPLHILLIPKHHISSLSHCTTQDAAMLGDLLAAVPRIAAEHRLEKGFRVVINTGPDGGQTVDHLHLHLLAGRAMSWPPG